MRPPPQTNSRKRKDVESGETELSQVPEIQVGFLRIKLLLFFLFFVLDLEEFGKHHNLSN